MFYKFSSLKVAYEFGVFEKIEKFIVTYAQL
jgi:hypothetical protein